jgi:hypothetical protein
MKFDITLTSPTGRPDTFVAIEAENEQAARDMKDQLLIQSGALYPVEQWTVASVVPTPDETPPGNPSIMPMYYPNVDPVLTAEELLAQLHAQQST